MAVALIDVSSRTQTIEGPVPGDHLRRLPYLIHIPCYYSHLLSVMTVRDSVGSDHPSCSSIESFVYFPVTSLEVNNKVAVCKLQF